MLQHVLGAEALISFVLDHLLQKMLAAVGTMTDEILYIVFPQFLVIKQALSKLLHCILQPKGKNDFSKLGVLLQ